MPPLKVCFSQRNGYDQHFVCCFISQIPISDQFKSHLPFPQTLQKDHYHLHFIDEENELGSSYIAGGLDHECEGWVWSQDLWPLSAWELASSQSLPWAVYSPSSSVSPWTGTSHFLSQPGRLRSSLQVYSAVKWRDRNFSGSRLQIPFILEVGFSASGLINGGPDQSWLFGYDNIPSQAYVSGSADIKEVYKRIACSQEGMYRLS